MKFAIIAFDQFTDIDVFLMWDILKRVKNRGWDVRIVGEKSHHISTTGITIPMHEGGLAWANEADVVLFSSGPGTRVKIRDENYLASFRLDPEKQMIGSMCSGALILAAMGLLDGKRATTYPTAKAQLEGYGVEVVEKPFVVNGNVATAAGCLAAQYLIGWVIERLTDTQTKDFILSSIQPVGEGMSFDGPSLEKLYANFSPPSVSV